MGSFCQCVQESLAQVTVLALNGEAAAQQSTVAEVIAGAKVLGQGPVRAG